MTALSCPTGFRNQSVQLADMLVEKGHEIHYMGNSYQGKTIEKAKLSDRTFNFFIHGEKTGRSYFMNEISDHLKKHKSDRLYVLLDTFMVFQNGFMNKDLSPAKTFFWFPSDGGGGLPKNCGNVLRKVDVPVAMSKFAQKQAKDYHGIETEYIPHGIDPQMFYRYGEKEREELRAKWGLKNKFVIGVVARNQPRKNLDRTIKAMSIIREKIPNAVLFLHLDPNDPANKVFNLNSLIKKYNLENRVVFSGMTASQGFPDSKMNDVYNLFDVFFLTTSGEGFGICTIEAMSCEIPVVATDYTTTQEIVLDNQAGLGIKLSGTEKIDIWNQNLKNYDKQKMNGTVTGSWEVERGICSVDDAAKKVIYLYNNPDIVKQMGKKGRKAVLRDYDFKKVVGPKWIELLEE